MITKASFVDLELTRTRILKEKTEKALVNFKENPRIQSTSLNLEKSLLEFLLSLINKSVSSYESTIINEALLESIVLNTKALQDALAVKVDCIAVERITEHNLEITRYEKKINELKTLFDKLN